ncbi:DNA polymerase III subunit delta [Candidatus Lariskella endosymbiont of Hedychridium roseum]|uniref:DNA polymerase III subunit delta n=1 Tax=Candidatus Lariskella endosymbiont of Hedychridium roseum TaxID=3077949 RepID=UPI0030D23373
MTEIKFNNVEKFFQEFRSTPKFAVIYGSDDGMILSAYKKIIYILTRLHSFSTTIIEHDYKQLKDYEVLKDDARSLSLFDTGYNIIVIRNIPDNIDKALINTLGDLSAINCFVLIIAPEIKKTSKAFFSLKSLKNAVFIPCYTQDRNATEQLVRKLFAKHKVEYEYNVVRSLVDILPQHYLCAYYEIYKLLLYKMDENGICIKISYDDLAILMQDSDVQADEICLSFLNNDYKKVSSYISDAKLRNFNPILFIKLMQSYLMRTIYVKSEIEKAISKDTAIAKLKPPIFWRYKTAFSKACDKLTYNAISNLLEKLIYLETACKQNYSMQFLLLENFMISNKLKL